MKEYNVVFEDVEVLVVAKDTEDAQEAAIEQCEAYQGYSTSIKSIRFVQAV